MYLALKMTDVNMTSSLEKILKSIPRVQDSKCILKQYSKSHSSLTIEISGKGLKDLYLVFEGVERIQCPVSWQGANIYLGSSEECIRILNRLQKGFEDLPKGYLTEKYHLYKFQNQNFDIHILANSIYLANNLSSS